MYEKYSASLFGTVIKVLHDGEEGLVHLRLPANFESVEVKDPNSERTVLFGNDLNYLNTALTQTGTGYVDIDISNYY